MATTGDQAGRDAITAGSDRDPAASSPGVPEEMGGDPACWAHLVCPECGAITSGTHRPGCGLALGADR